ncbi:MAG: xylose isomerase [Planctomycetota bacterium]
MAARFDPAPADKFTFGLWTTGNPGLDPFGPPTRPRLDPVANVRKLAEVGAYGFNFHDDDLIPPDATPAQAQQIKADVKKVMEDTGIVAAMATTNLFAHPAFKDGAFTATSARVRAYAVQKTMRGIDLGVEMGAKLYVFWGGREGVEADGSKDPVQALKWYRECLNFLTAYVQDQGYDLKFALEAKPNEPRGDIYLPTTGAMLAFIETLEHEAMVGVNPEYAHETMAGLNFHHAVAQAIERGKLFHIDLNGQKIGRYDQDLRFASEDLKGNFFLVRLLERSGYAGPRHFDAHAYRTEDLEGVWDFARGCMRSYKILKEKAQRFDEDREVQELLRTCSQSDRELEAILERYQRVGAAKLKAAPLDPARLAERKLAWERLDQITVEILLGVR